MPSSNQKSLLICGSGRTLFLDLQRVPGLLRQYDVMAVNEAFLALSEVHHLVSYHSELIWPLIMLRGPREYINGEYLSQWHGVTHSQREDKGVKRVWAFEDGGGTSSFFAVQIAHELGYDRIILCGVPYDASGKFLQPHWEHGHDYAETDGWEIWEKWYNAGKFVNVRSMSGRTRVLLGEPERNWLWQ